MAAHSATLTDMEKSKTACIDNNMSGLMGSFLFGGAPITRLTPFISERTRYESSGFTVQPPCELLELY